MAETRAYEMNCRLNKIIYKYISEMAEESKHDKYIVCSKYKCKYINDEEHINTDFGYTRLEQRYTTCVKCREINNIKCK